MPAEDFSQLGLGNSANRILGVYNDRHGVFAERGVHVSIITVTQVQLRGGAGDIAETEHQLCQRERLAVTFLFD